MTTRSPSVCYPSSFRKRSEPLSLPEETPLGRKAFSRSNPWSLATLTGEQGLVGEAGWPIIAPSITTTPPTSQGSR